MKYVTLSLAHGQAVRHPMHQFIIDNDGYDETRLLGSTVTEGHLTAVFHVDGWPPTPYEEALQSVETIQEYTLSRQFDKTFTVYVRESLAERDREITDAFGRAGLVTWLPLVYRDDGTLEITLVGPSETIQNALEETPDGVTIDVNDIGDFDTRDLGGHRDVTTRQAEAVSAAVDTGYYENPREGSVADVAEVLGCSPSTAAEHLRRAERTVMRSFIRDRYSNNR